MQVTWLGLSPLYMAESCSVVCWLLLLSPCPPGKHHPLLQASLDVDILIATLQG